MGKGYTAAGAKATKQRKAARQTFTASEDGGVTYSNADHLSGAGVYRASKLDRIGIIRRGVPAVAVEKIVREMDISKERLYAVLHFPRATVDRKIREKATLSPEQSERILGLKYLVGQVEAMVQESGNPEGFNADHWLAGWLEEPLPALGGARPSEFMDTVEGQALVSQLLAQSQSGAYA
jgi:putative toxin-antitoxin system antitoxin component (TIGR02293 family)